MILHLHSLKPLERNTEYDNVKKGVKTKEKIIAIIMLIILALLNAISVFAVVLQLAYK